MLLGLEESTEASEAEAPDYPDYPDYLSELPPFPKSSPLSRPLSPPPKWSFQAEEDRLKACPDNAFYRILRQVAADIRAECQREAEALGFSSWEAKESHEKEEGRKWLEEYVEKHGHLPQPPTVNEKQRAIFERRQKIHLEAERELLEHPCHCPDHIAFWFCPQRLRSYKSCGRDPSDFQLLQSLNAPDLNIQVKEGDPSNRLPESWLENIWAMPSQKGVLHLPLWAKRDDVVQGMINREEVNKVLYSGDPEPQKEDPPHRPIVSSSVSTWPDSLVRDNAEGLRVIEHPGSPEESTAGLNVKQSIPRVTSDVDMSLTSPQAETNTELSGTGTHSAGGPPTHGRFSDMSDLGVHENISISHVRSPTHGRFTDISDLGVHETIPTSHVRSFKINKWPGAKKEATRKAALSDKVQNHAQDVLNLLAGDSRARATSLSRHSFTPERIRTSGIRSA